MKLTSEQKFEAAVKIMAAFYEANKQIEYQTRQEMIIDILANVDKLAAAIPEDEPQQPKPAGDYKDRMKAEFNELKERREKLYAFFSTDKFLNLDKERRDLMYAQHLIMEKYLEILIKRCELEGIKL